MSGYSLTNCALSLFCLNRLPIWRVRHQMGHLQTSDPGEPMQSMRMNCKTARLMSCISNFRRRRQLRILTRPPLRTPILAGCRIRSSNARCAMPSFLGEMLPSHTLKRTLGKGGLLARTKDGAYHFKGTASPVSFVPRAVHSGVDPVAAHLDAY